MKLYGWQTECLEKWAENQYRGIVNVVTGAGKTVLALAAVQLLDACVDGASLKVKIVVPKTFLVRQWFYALQEFLGVSRSDIGFYFGSHKSEPNRKYMIYVINSARYSFAKHIVNDSQNRVLIIADECHHYASEENSKIFDFMRMLPDYTKCYTLGLSATPYCKNYEEVLAPNLGKEIYRFSFVQALEAEIISSFSLINIRLNLDVNERDEYNGVTDSLSKTLSNLKKYCPKLIYRNNASFFPQLERLANSSGDYRVRELAQSVLFLSYKRKEIVHLARSRVACVIDLVRLIDRKLKIIIFGERIEMANEIYNRICLFRNDVGIYHSKSHKNTRQMTLRKFEDSEINVLVSCKTMDEGLNVSDTDIGVVVSSTSSERQRVQRLGRVLRKKQNKRQACFYYLFVGGTMEESLVFEELTDNLSSSINVLDLYYDEQDGAFENPFYEELSEKAINEAISKGWNFAKIDELKRNFELGRIKCDWMLSEKDCICSIKKAKSKAEKNYFIAMLLIMRAGHRIPQNV